MKFALFSVLLASVVLAACGGGDGGSGSSSNSNVLANETRQLAEGQYVPILWSLAATRWKRRLRLMALPYLGLVELLVVTVATM